VDETGSRSCPMAGCGISSVEPAVPTAKELVTKTIKCKRL